MTEEVAKIGVAIVANDRSEAGWKSAEKRAEQSQKRVGSLNRKAFNDNDRATARSTKSMVSSLARIEQAAARALGGRSLTAGLAGRFGATGQAASAMGEGLASASAAGGLLETAAGGVAMAVGGTIAVLGAAAYAAFKFTDGWAQGAAQLARTAEIIGISTKALTEFSSAAERAGVDKGAAVGAVGSLSQTLNDARYGRNTQALEVLRRLNVGMKLNKDGTVDTAAMLPAIADAIQRQNSSGRRTVARLLGIPESALPAFSQGGKALAADMKDSDSTGVVINDADGEMAKRAARKGTLVGQLKDRGLNDTAREAARNFLDGKVGDAVVDAAQGIDKIIHGDFGPAVKDFGRAVDNLVDGTRNMLGSGGGPTVSGIAARIEKLGERSRQNQISPKGAIGVMQVMPGTARATASRLGIPFDEGRYRKDEGYNRMLGQQHLGFLLRRYGGNETLATAAYNAGEGRVDKWLQSIGDPRKGGISEQQFAARIPFKETRNYVQRVMEGHYGERGEIPVKVDIQVNQHGKVTGVKTTQGNGNAPAVSHSMNIGAYRY
ncbi:lytic transglycosylase domain-containing protein [Novosphingobium sp. KA1]|uniref:lytic transglycosylase domain-containing protein n=1 Tax=Novosphingobium sp. (strain KA1) TaxID=164608 RepID=UPI001A8FE87C|nr:lytic transglycosylase domain-containing protein [Novosphingobium sp. KA1]